MEERFDEVVLLDENGEEARFSHILTFLYEGERYVALEPIEEGAEQPEEEEEAEIVLMHIVLGEDGDTYQPVENEVLMRVYAAMKEKGYDPINQIVGYLISGDPTYITSYNNARYLIRMLERDELLEELVRFYVNAPEHQDQSGMER